MDRQELERAAIEAELRTGRREPTEAAAKRHIALRIVRMFAGLVLLLAGAVMLVLPGPGLLVIAGGLVLLAEDVVWADRLLRFIRRRTPGIPEDGSIPRSTLLVGGLVGLAGILVAVALL